MLHTSTPEDDDALADALADAWVDRAASDPVIRRAALRAAGLMREPDSQSELARQCGLSESAVALMVRTFRARLAAETLKDPRSPSRLRRAAASYLSLTTDNR